VTFTIDSKLHHPNVVTLIGACLEPPRMCMVMELCEYSLHHLLHMTNHFLGVHQLMRIAVSRWNCFPCFLSSSADICVTSRKMWRAA
jgi:serine/threonine protein kinase